MIEGKDLGFTLSVFPFPAQSPALIGHLVSGAQGLDGERVKTSKGQGGVRTYRPRERAQFL